MSESKAEVQGPKNSATQTCGFPINKRTLDVLYFSSGGCFKISVDVMIHNYAAACEVMHLIG